MIPHTRRGAALVVVALVCAASIPAVLAAGWAVKRSAEDTAERQCVVVSELIRAGLIFHATSASAGVRAFYGEQLPRLNRLRASIPGCEEPLQ